MSAALKITVPAEFDAFSKAIALEASKATAAKMIEEFDMDAEAVRRFLGDDVELIKDTKKAPKKAPKKETKKKETKKDDKSDTEDEKPKKKKRGANAYIRFSNENRRVATDELQADCLEKGVKFEQKLVVTELAKRWKALDEDEQQVWKDQAKSSDSDSD